MGLISEEKKLCMQNFKKEQKQPPVVILEQVIFYNIFIYLYIYIIYIYLYNLYIYNCCKENKQCYYYFP